MIADIIVDLRFGDSGKGKVTNTLLESGEYTHCVRYQGSSNAGHTIYKNGKKFVTHVVPTGIFHENVKCIIGPGCVVNPKLLLEEINELNNQGLDTKGRIFLDKRVCIVTSQHMLEDQTDSSIGTTKRGNGPAYRDKYSRKSLKFGEFNWGDSPFEIIDIYDEFFNSKDEVVALFEGAQGFGLDVDWGEYPYVTSSHCSVGGAILNGIPPKCIRNVYGVLKAYDTYVGAKLFEDKNNPIFEKIREIGQEYGATTGRPRQINYLNLDETIRASRINGVTDFIINKVDILKEVGDFSYIYQGKLHTPKDESSFKNQIGCIFAENLRDIKSLRFSYSPETI